jgi:DNA-directed RNA polymerase specialized sigma24 family protein
MATEEDTQARLEEMEPLVRRLARRWARDRPTADDLAQVARLAMWLILKERLDAPIAHLVRGAQEALFDESIRGKSVDGRLNGVFRRPRQYTVQSLQDPYGRLDGTLEDALAGGPVHAHNLWESPTEGEAMGHILYEALRALLSLQEDAVLLLLLAGYRQYEIGPALGLTEKQVRWARQRLQRKLRTLTDDEVDPFTVQEFACSKAAQALWSRRRPLFHLSLQAQVILAEITEALQQ